MSEKIFDPAIHQDSEHLEGFRFRHTLLADSIAEYRKSQPEGTEITCDTLAAQIGLAGSTLKKLKAGQIIDPRGSTYWLLWKAFKIDPRRLMGIPVDGAALDAAGMHEIKIRLDEKRQRIAELTQEVEQLREDKLRLQRMYNDASNRASSAEAEVKHLEIMKTTLYKERDERDDERKDVKTEHKRLRVALTIMCAVVIISLGACVYVLWDALNPAVGFFRR